MGLADLLLLVVVGWTLLGLLGLGLSLVRRERAKVLKGLGWLVGVWVVYLVVVVGVSLLSPQKTVVLGQDQCFDEMCFAVTNAVDVPVFVGRNQIANGSRLVRVTIRVRNKARGKTESERLLRAYLVDGRGRRWEESRGINGNRLTEPVAAGGEMVCEPVFRVAADATQLGLVLTHGRWQPGLLVVGDSDSLWHKKTVVALGL